MQIPAIPKPGWAGNSLVWGNDEEFLQSRKPGFHCRFNSGRLKPDCFNLAF
jgi:hypothetical protein